MTTVKSRLFDQFWSFANKDFKEQFSGDQKIPLLPVLNVSEKISSKRIFFSKLLHIVNSGCKESTRIGQNPVHHWGNHSPSYARNFHTRLLTISQRANLIMKIVWFYYFSLFSEVYLLLSTYIGNYKNTK